MHGRLGRGGHALVRGFGGNAQGEMIHEREVAGVSLRADVVTRFPERGHLTTVLVNVSTVDKLNISVKISGRPAFLISPIMERAQIHRVSVADQAAAILRQKILDGEL